jgi:hypothetical protein
MYFFSHASPGYQGEYTDDSASEEALPRLPTCKMGSTTQEASLGDHWGSDAISI